MSKRDGQADASGMRASKSSLMKERGLTELPQKPHNAEKLRTGHRTLREWILQAAPTSSRRGESDIAHHTETDQDRKNDFCGKQGTFVTTPYDRQFARKSPIRPTINCSSRELDRRLFSQFHRNALSLTQFSCTEPLRASGYRKIAI
jgi:hypothetical protein